ncbi:MAG: calcium-binding protein [Paracoccaceae bacterium]
MPNALTSLITALSQDPGLRANVSAAERAEGQLAAATMNAQLLRIIEARGFNNDGIISPAELAAISRIVQADAEDYAIFLEGHGNDEGNVETGYHLLQNDGGSLEFRGRDFADTVVDAIYHYGFDVISGRYVNEDGNANETTRDVAGWFNFFLNGKSTVFGSEAGETLGSGMYSDLFAAARNETFLAGGGDDEIWADVGSDKVYAGEGNDVSGGGAGNDTMMGEAGNDSLYGDIGADSIDGGSGSDRMGGGDSNDRMLGGGGNDTIYGDDGNDTMSGDLGNDEMGGGNGSDRMLGGEGNDGMHGAEMHDVMFGNDGDDTLHGSDGNDRVHGDTGNDSMYGGSDNDILWGGDGRDTIKGGDGSDVVRGNRGRDLITLWEDAQVRDVLVFSFGDSGRVLGGIDLVEGFSSGTDKIDLRSFGAMTFEEIDFAGGRNSAYYDGKYLRIDRDGDRATDMMVEFAWTESLSERDFLFA